MAVLTHELSSLWITVLDFEFFSHFLLAVL